MKRIDALKKAEEIAKKLKILAPLFDDLKIFEIILFGSTTRKCDDEFVDDVDLLIIDNGVLSSTFLIKIDDDEDYYYYLRDNINFFAQMLFEDDLLKLTDEQDGFAYDLFNENYVDLHVLPLKFFRNKNYREEVKKRHHDPMFFQNLFSTAMRWRIRKQFVPTDVSYFERKYKVRLQDLKK